VAEQPVVLITGAAAGIGAAIARAFVQAGWRAVLVDRNDQGEMTARSIGSAARFVRADVADETEVNRAVATIAGDEKRLDALVCNAGVMIRKPLAHLSLHEWNSVIATNLTSTFLCVRACETLLRDSRGAVITIASTRAHMSEPNTESYSASKGGLLALTHSLAVSLGPEVRVNCVSPGWIDTQSEALRAEDHAQHPAGRVGKPEDIANLAVWLAGPPSGFITGSEFIVDGGMTRKMIYTE
jgi:NAD(P)-dependent dehydrogenase (short-subunit alcohol dehydrogenase family)